MNLAAFELADYLEIEASFGIVISHKVLTCCHPLMPHLDFVAIPRMTGC